MRVTSMLLLLFATACGGATPEPADPTGSEPATGAELTATECKAQGGTVVHDMGDGAVHAADYHCPGSGKHPLGSIARGPDVEMADEGAVCCPAE